MSDTDFSSIPPPSWTSEAQAAYLACALDTDGWVSLRFTSHGEGMRIFANVGVVNASIPLLERFAEFAGVPTKLDKGGIRGTDARGIVTREDIRQASWCSPPYVIAILGKALPYLIAKQERAAWTLEFCRSRITPAGHVARKSQPYTPRCWELARFVSLANKRRTEFPLLADFLERSKPKPLKHGASGTPEHDCWVRAKGRSPGMCKEWSESFLKFFAGIGPRPSDNHQLTRPDASKPFGPGNGFWGTVTEHNRLTSRNHLIEFEGKVRTMAEWAELLGMEYGTLAARINAYGWSTKKALLTPVKKR